MTYGNNFKMKYNGIVTVYLEKMFLKIDLIVKGFLLL